MTDGLSISRDGSRTEPDRGRLARILSSPDRGHPCPHREIFRLDGRI